LLVSGRRKKGRKNEMNIKWVGTPNFTKGRNNRKIEAIVDHITAGNYPGCRTVSKVGR